MHDHAPSRFSSRFDEGARVRLARLCGTSVRLFGSRLFPVRLLLLAPFVVVLLADLTRLAHGIDRRSTNSRTHAAGFLDFQVAPS